MQVKVLDQVHPDYDGDELARLNALHEGGRSWHALKDVWLPKYARESADTWAERKAVAGYINHAGPIVSMLAAMLFSTGAQVETPAGDFWPDFLANVDRQGTDWDTFWREAIESAQVGQRFYCWVNMPSRAGVAVKNLADEDSAGLRNAFLVPLSASQVRNWARDERGLSWVMARGVEEVQESPETERVRRIRWTAITRTEITQWVWTATAEKPEPGPEDVAEMVARVPHTLGRLPVVEVLLPSGLWTMGKLADPAIMAASARNDLLWALHQAASELLVIKTKADGEPTLGHGAYLSLQPDDDAMFIGPSGVAFEHLERAVEGAREDLYRVVHQMALSADASASSSARSGDSKAMDWQALGIILASYQAIALEAMTATLQIVAELRGDTVQADQIGASGLEGWRTEDLTVWLEQLVLSAEAATMSPTFRREAGKHQAHKLLGDHVGDDIMATIVDEIDAWTPPPPSFSLPPRPVEDGGEE